MAGGVYKASTRTSHHRRGELPMTLNQIAHAMNTYGARIGREFTLIQVRAVKQLILKREYNRVHPDILKLLHIRISNFEMFKSGIYCPKGAGQAFRDWVSDRPERRKELIDNNPELRRLIYSWASDGHGITKEKYDLVLPLVFEVEKSEIERGIWV